MFNPILTVEEAEYVEGYTLKLRFSDGVVKLYDFSHDYNEGICTKLKDMEYFRRFRLDPFTVDWNGEIGFAPEYLYSHGTTV